ncbi:A-kinase-interacting protein 1 [Bufo bufo]|uniref:A-kinase-interacting protein 1 n=1 Tax=Bufo bufo TaxID=8384 RepID=UPI001ABEDF9A|nr:A-kinase-interacting protein 1 [Bufo bufo]
MEKSYVWMEDSIRRTSELGRQVLERAQRRDVDWWSARGQDPQSPEIPEEDRLQRLEDAFSTLSRFMHHTTERCERYHSSIPAQAMNPSEIQHISRFHRTMPLKPQTGWTSAAAPPQSSGRNRDPRDVYIEVAPGTYRISARSPNLQSQTHLVNITPGQSVDLTFNV